MAWHCGRIVDLESNWGSGNTKLKLHVQDCTATYIFVHSKTQTQIYKYYKTQTQNWRRDLRGPRARTTRNNHSCILYYISILMYSNITDFSHFTIADPVGAGACTWRRDLRGPGARRAVYRWTLGSDSFSGAARPPRRLRTWRGNRRIPSATAWAEKSAGSLDSTRESGIGMRESGPSFLPSSLLSGFRLFKARQDWPNSRWLGDRSEEQSNFVLWETYWLNITDNIQLYYSDCTIFSILIVCYCSSSIL